MSGLVCLLLTKRYGKPRVSRSAGREEHSWRSDNERFRSILYPATPGTVVNAGLRARLGALYGRYPPLVNACRKPGEWQTYDIIFYAPKFADKKRVRPATLTVLHNGILIHHAVEVGGRSPKIRLGLQDHLNPVRYRNIWVRELHDYDYTGKRQDSEGPRSAQP